MNDNNKVLNIMDLKEKEDYIQIIEEGDWKDRIGIIHRVDKETGIVDVFCLQDPSNMFQVGIWNADSIIKVDINNLGRKGYEQQVV